MAPTGTPTGGRTGASGPASSAPPGLGRFPLPAQQLTVVLAVVYVSRLKGQKSLTRDFGFRIRLRDAKALVVGATLEIGLTLALLPILKLDPHAKNQQLLRDLKEHRDAGTVV